MRKGWRLGGGKVLYPRNDEGDWSYKVEIFWEVCVSQRKHQTMLKKTNKLLKKLNELRTVVHS